MKVCVLPLVRTALSTRRWTFTGVPSKTLTTVSSAGIRRFLNVHVASWLTVRPVTVTDGPPPLGGRERHAGRARRRDERVARLQRLLHHDVAGQRRRARQPDEVEATLAVADRRRRGRAGPVGDRRALGRAGCQPLEAGGRAARDGDRAGEVPPVGRLEAVAVELVDLLDDVQPDRAERRGDLGERRPELVEVVDEGVVRVGERVGAGELRRSRRCAWSRVRLPASLTAAPTPRAKMRGCRRVALEGVGGGEGRVHDGVGAVGVARLLPARRVAGGRVAVRDEDDELRQRTEGARVQQAVLPVRVLRVARVVLRVVAGARGGAVRR